jgi:hypothetical protein
LSFYKREGRAKDMIDKFSGRLPTKYSRLIEEAALGYRGRTIDLGGADM